MAGQRTYQVLADSVLALHAGFVGFVVLGLVVVLVGNLRGWSWVNTFWFRASHLGAICIVTAETWLGIPCPVTVLEMWLRRKAGGATYEGDFVMHWLDRVVYADAPPWAFLVGHTAFALLVLGTWYWRPPVRRLTGGPPDG